MKQAPVASMTQNTMAINGIKDPCNDLENRDLTFGIDQDGVDS